MSMREPLTRMTNVPSTVRPCTRIAPLAVICAYGLAAERVVSNSRSKEVPDSQSKPRLEPRFRVGPVSETLPAMPSLRMTKVALAVPCATVSEPTAIRAVALITLIRNSEEPLYAISMPPETVTPRMPSVAFETLTFAQAFGEESVGLRRSGSDGETEVTTVFVVLSSRLKLPLRVKPSEPGMPDWSESVARPAMPLLNIVQFALPANPSTVTPLAIRSRSKEPATATVSEPIVKSNLPVAVSPSTRMDPST